MAVYLIEVPNDSTQKLSKEKVKSIIETAFEVEGVDVKVRRKHLGSLKDLEQQELYSATMAAG